jgi:hypothetical protein
LGNPRKIGPKAIPFTLLKRIPIFLFQERRNERFTDLILRGDGLKKASVGREAVFTINSKQVRNASPSNFRLKPATLIM